MLPDSSDDENLDKLREAADSQFINDAMFDKSLICEKKSQTEKLQSLRRSKDDDEQFNSFRVSPEFRGYVAKHLSTMLDEVLKHKLDHSMKHENHPKTKRRKGGVKLLRTSPHYLKLKSNNSELVRHKIAPETPEDDDDDDRFKSVAVTPEEILSQKETKHWSNRSKARVYSYIQTKHGLILK
ncbi:C12orf43 -like [Asbolus verrucosus]|uniref:Protein CUSTOS n=1 Tax=Asbolus verrucosus TaxID=1661398 RepID=A0A482W4R7_ASBVE|nr:C12orf43 -like [Asbolus verrucosus]